MSNMSKFDEDKRKLIEYIQLYVNKHIVGGKVFTSNMSFGHDLNAYHHRNFRETKSRQMFEYLHNAVPLVLKYWKGDGNDLTAWLQDMLDHTLNSTPKQPPWSGENRELWWNLYYVIRDIKEDA